MFGDTNVNNRRKMNVQSRGRVSGSTFQRLNKLQHNVQAPAVNLASRRQPSSDAIGGRGLTQHNGSRSIIECQLIYEYIDLHPELPIRSIIIDQDQENGEADQQAGRPFLVTMDDNILRSQVQAVNETPSSESGVAEVT
ncbi:hypothetical protein ACJMK2_018226 [Sinanodonta woodiana]|uniref:Uncharacterized protein n=1 Tax=Sinanodonta woodiana TaxID=1069815 RepID=A0ABD3UCU9_SINWO